jgi:hypothetical protein
MAEENLDISLKAIEKTLLLSTYLDLYLSEVRRFR